MSLLCRSNDRLFFCFICWCVLPRFLCRVSPFALSTCKCLLVCAPLYLRGSYVVIAGSSSSSSSSSTPSSSAARSQDLPDEFLGDVLRGVARSMLAAYPAGSWTEQDAVTYVRSHFPALPAREARTLAVSAAAGAQMAAATASVYVTHFLSESAHHRALAAGTLARMAAWGQGLNPIPPVREDLASWVDPPAPPRDAGVQTAVDVTDAACGGETSQMESVGDSASSSPPFAIHAPGTELTMLDPASSPRVGQGRKRKASPQAPVPHHANLPSLLSLNIPPPPFAVGRGSKRHR